MSEHRVSVPSSALSDFIDKTVELEELKIKIRKLKQWFMIIPEPTEWEDAETQVMEVAFKEDDFNYWLSEFERIIHSSTQTKKTEIEK